MSGYRKISAKQGALTLWRQQRKGLVRTRKVSDRARRTHKLGMGEEGTCQDTERNRQREEHSLAEDGRGRNLSGHEKKPTKQGALTLWRQHREKLVRTRKETDRARGTHFLEMAEGGTYQNTKRN